VGRFGVSGISSALDAPGSASLGDGVILPLCIGAAPLIDGARSFGAFRHVRLLSPAVFIGDQRARIVSNHLIGIKLMRDARSAFDRLA
jgi:hypothetical protein